MCNILIDKTFIFIFSVWSNHYRLYICSKQTFFQFLTVYLCLNVIYRPPCFRFIPLTIRYHGEPQVHQDPPPRSHHHHPHISQQERRGHRYHTCPWSTRSSPSSAAPHATTRPRNAGAPLRSTSFAPGPSLIADSPWARTTRIGRRLREQYRGPWASAAVAQPRENRRLTERLKESRDSAERIEDLERRRGELERRMDELMEENESLRRKGEKKSNKYNRGWQQGLRSWRKEDTRTWGERARSSEDFEGRFRVVSGRTWKPEEGTRREERETERKHSARQTESESCSHG